MKRLRVWALRFSGLFTQARRDEDLAAEMDSHLQLHIDDNIRAGMTREEARRDAILKLGGLEPTKEAYRERRSIPVVEHFLRDFRFALRQLGKNPGFTFTAMAMLALGVCASVSIFAFVDAALIKPLPYPNPNRLADVTETVALFSRANLSYLDYLDWKKLNSVFQSLDVYNGNGYTLSTASGPELVRGMVVSDGFFRTLGVAPALGRDFYSGEDKPGTPNTVLLSYPTWQKRFAGKKDVIGRSIRLSGIPNTIIGVLPQSFQFAPSEGAEFWAPLHASGNCELRRSCHNLYGIARLRDGITMESALAAMRVIARQLESQYPDSNRGQGASVLPLSEVISGDVRPILLVLLGGAGLLLAIACVNMASLLLVRSETRRREIAVREALGASTGRLIGQFTTEALVLVASGSILGLLSAAWVMQVLARLVPEEMIARTPFLNGISMNLDVIAFAAGVSLVAAVLCSITPILRLTSSGIRDGLAEGSRGSAGIFWRRFGANLVVVELAIAVVLLVGAGLLATSFYRLLHVQLGFQPDHLATMQVYAPDVRYAKHEQTVTLGRQILARVASIPGVRSSAITSVLPVSFNGNTEWIRIVGRPYHGEHNEVNQRDTSADYFHTLQAHLVRGRYFTDAEDASKPRVVIVNEALARQYFPGEDPIGKKLGDTDLAPNSLKEIVGIIADVKDGSLDSEIWPAVYYPFNQSSDTYFSVLARTNQGEAQVLTAIRAAVQQIDPEIGVMGEATMTGRINNSPSAYLHRSSAWLVGGFACLALLLGVVGLYGVIAYSVSQRTREIGVRMALGAQQSAVYRLVFKEAVRLAAAGIVTGTLCAIGAATLMRKLLFGVQTWDAPTLAGVALVLSVAALLASFLPARRAASVNPVEALRAE